MGLDQDRMEGFRCQHSLSVHSEWRHTLAVYTGRAVRRARRAHGNELGLRRIHYHTLSASVSESDSNSS